MHIQHTSEDVPVSLELQRTSVSEFSNVKCNSASITGPTWRQTKQTTVITCTHTHTHAHKYARTQVQFSISGLCVDMGVSGENPHLQRENVKTSHRRTQVDPDLLSLRQKCLTLLHYSLTVLKLCNVFF